LLIVKANKLTIIVAARIFFTSINTAGTFLSLGCEKRGGGLAAHAKMRSLDYANGEQDVNRHEKEGNNPSELLSPAMFSVS